MNLLSVNLLSDFKSLKPFEERIRFDDTGLNEFDPICLVGLNGSGKSHFLELIAEGFMMAEYFVRNVKLPQSTSPLYFEIEYSLTATGDSIYYKLSNTKKDKLKLYILQDGEYQEKHSIEYNDLPKKILGYSSGLNETLSSSFYEILNDFSEKLSSSANDPSKYYDIVDNVRMTYLDNNTNLLLVVSNLASKNSSKVIQDYTNLKGLVSFKIEINKKIRVKVKTNAQIDGILEQLQKFSYDGGDNINEDHIDFDFIGGKAFSNAIDKVFGGTVKFFEALMVLNNLNSLAISKKYKKWISDNRKKGVLIKMPEVPEEDRFFNISNIKFRTKDDQIIGYEGLSDGEHQLVQTLGALSIIEEPDTLFLFDEPDTHYNPEWRSRLFAEYSAVCKGRNQEIILSTHSPFIVSSVKKHSVFHFVRDKGTTIKNPTFQTFGCSIDIILRRLFNKKTMTPSLPVQVMVEIAEKSRDEIIENMDMFGESHSKTMLYKKLEELK